MTIEEFVEKLDGVKQTGHGVMARCPAHDDRHPSLSVKSGDRGILVRCWSGCTIEEICTALGLRVQDLFFDSLPDRRVLNERKRMRKRDEAEQTEALRREGLKLDVLRASEHLILTTRGLAISTWPDTQLDAALDRLGDAYAILWKNDHEHSAA